MQRFYILTSSILAIGYFRLFHWPKIRQWSVVRQANQNQTEDQILCLSSSKFRRTMSRLKSENVISEIKNIVIWLRDQWSNDLWLIILLGILFKFFFFLNWGRVTSHMELSFPILSQIQGGTGCRSRVIGNSYSKYNIDSSYLYGFQSWACICI